MIKKGILITTLLVSLFIGYGANDKHTITPDNLYSKHTITPPAPMKTTQIDYI